MMKHHELEHILHAAAEEALPAAEINLAPTVIARVAQQQVTRRARRALFAGTVIIALMLAIFLMSVPPVRAGISDLLRHLGFELANEQEMADTTAVMAEAIHVTPQPTLPYDTFLQQVPFTLRLPTWLPDGLELVGWDVDPHSELGAQIVLYYMYASGWGDPEAPVVVLEMTDGDLNPWFLSEQALQEVTVNGQPGAYIQGGWMTEEPVEPGEEVHGLFWDDSTDDYYLSWEEGGLTYRIRAHHIDLTLEAILRIAESLE